MKKFMKYLLALTLSLGLVFSAVPAFAKTPDVDFIDVSHWQGSNGLSLSYYQSIKSQGVKGVVVKVSQGTHILDPAAKNNIANARKAGFQINAYHFASFIPNDAEVVKEAQWFDQALNSVGFDKNKDGYVVLDLEIAPTGVEASQLTYYANLFLNEMRQLGYQKVDIYSGSSFYNNNLVPADLSVDHPWLARYPIHPEYGKSMPRFANGQGAWQWSSTYRFSGYYQRLDVSQDFAGKYTSKINGELQQDKKVQSRLNYSIVAYLKFKGIDSSFSTRGKLADIFGIKAYKGTASQNLALLSSVQNSKLDIKSLLAQDSKSASHSVSQTITKTYAIKRGDNFWNLENQFKLVHGTLQKLNTSVNSSRLRIGQIIIISKTFISITHVSPATSYYSTYTVRHGDSLSLIGNKLHMNWRDIAKLNGIKSPYVIHLNQKIKYHK